MGRPFIDLFSAHAELYAAARPRYPASLFKAIADWAPRTRTVWDAGAGSGQAAVGLAEHFDEVWASDPSERQIQAAIQHPKVRYSVQPAEQTNYPDASMSAICVAQALHWFDHARFFREAQRVLEPGGVFVAVGYDWFELEPRFDSVFEKMILDEVRDKWAPEIALLWEGYRNIAMPFERIETPSFALEPVMSFHEFMAYVHTWSAVQRKIREEGPGFFEAAARELEALWGSPEQRRRIHMPLHVVAGRHRTV